MLLLLPGMSGFPYASSQARFSDIAVSHYPNAVFLKRTLLEQHTIPLWCNSILGGYPFAANPLSSLWYPFAWFALLFPLPFGFNLMVMLHLLWGGIGMIALLRRLKISQKGALIGGLAFSLMPKYFAHYGAGHLTLAYAVPWTPWLLLTTMFERRKWYAQPGLVLALIFLADVRWAAYAGLLWLAWDFFYKRGVREKQEERRIGTGGMVKRLSFQTAIAFLLCAPLGLPLLEYTRLSTRSQMGVRDIFAFSLEPSRYIGLLLPDLGGFHETMLYPGIILLCLALAAIIDWSGLVRFWMIVAVGALVFSLGSNLPGVELLAQLPGFSLLRVPPRILFIAGLAWAVLAAYGLDLIVAGISEKQQRALRLSLAAMLTFCLSFGIGSWLLTGTLGIPFIWSTVAISAFWLWLKFRERMSRSVQVGLVLLLMVVDLGFFNHSLFQMRPVEQVLGEGQAAAKYLAAMPGDFRVYSPSYSLPQQTAARYGLKLADGVDPLQLAGYAAYMEKASGVPRQGYSVTLPPFANGDPATANQVYIPDLESLYRSGVRYIAAEYDLDVSQEPYYLLLLKVIDQTRIYAVNNNNEAVDYIVPIEINPNEMIIENVESSRIEVPWNDYPGWEAKIDGQRVPLIVEDGLVVGVDDQGGEGQVVVSFRPMILYIGLFCAVVGIVILYVQQKRTYVS